MYGIVINMNLEKSASLPRRIIDFARENLNPRRSLLVRRTVLPFAATTILAASLPEQGSEINTTAQATVAGQQMNLEAVRVLVAHEEAAAANSGQSSQSNQARAQEARAQLVEKLTDRASQNSPTDKNTIRQNVSLLLGALDQQGINTPRVVAYTMATVDHETDSTFTPIREYNGEQQAVANGYKGGKAYYGRGFIQITHDENYQQIGQDIGQGNKLVENPDLALDPGIAAQVTADFMKKRGVADLAEKSGFRAAREPVNGTDKADKIATEADVYLAVINS